MLASQPGDIETNLESNNTMHIADSIKTSWNEYTESQQEDPTGAGFSNWVDSNDSQAETRRYIQDLRGVFNSLNRTGLSSGEFNYARTRTIQRIIESGSEPGGMTSSQLGTALNP